jgi:serine/threonine protein kinase/WD40 repeat protein
MSEPSLPEESIFAQAVDIDSASERLAFLDRACGGNQALRAEVEALLRASERSGDLLDLRENVADTRNLPACEGPGTVIGPYKLLEHIGEGGMGTVWMAQQTEPIQRRVAVKVVKAGMDSKQVLARFEAERQALALMEHPNIAKVLDAGKTPSGRPYFVMELVKGQPITTYCDEKRLGVRARLELFGDVCRAVQHAHQKGIIHRDLKPSNVLVAPYDAKPVIKVIDFGVAKAAGQRLTDKTLFTGFGALVGTPEYMSPEQAEVNNQDIDTRSDIYSLGVLLYELLTGSTPLTRQRIKDAALLEVLRVIREEEPPRPSTRLSKSKESLLSISAQRQTQPANLTKLVRGELDWIVMKALDKDRNRRYETANGLAIDVQRYLADEPVRACPPTALYRFRKFARRHKLFITATTVVAVTLLLAAATVTWKWWEAETARQREEAAREQAQNALARAETAEQDARADQARAVEAERTARLREAEALVGQARGTRLSQRPGQRFETLATLKKAVAIGRELKQHYQWFDPLRNEAIAALALPDIHITKEWAGFPAGSVWVALSDDFEVYARTTEHGGCTIRRVADDKEVAALPELGEPAIAAFGSGRTLALRGSSDGRFQLWDLTSDPLLRFEERGIDAWGFHPNGRLVAIEHRNGAISVFELATGAPLHRLNPAGIVHFQTLVFHPTEPLLAMSSHANRSVYVRDFRTGEVVASAANPDWDRLGGCAWSPDGRALLATDGEWNGNIVRFAFDSAAPAADRLRLLPRSLDGPGQGCAHLTFNPAGDRIVSRGWSTTVNLFDAVSGQFLLATPRIAAAGGDLRFDRTGTQLAGARVGERNERIGIWSVADGREYRSLVVKTPGAGTAIHCGGRLTAVSLSDGLAFFDLDSGRELERVAIPGGAGNVVFDGAGNLLSNGFGGCFRWPVRPNPANSGRLLIGPPELLSFRPGNRPISASNDGRVIAQAMFNGYGMEPFAGGWILHPKSSDAQRVDGTGMNFASVSPDGRWVAFAMHGGPVVVHDAATGERVWRSPAGSDFCRFSTDWLMTSGDGGHLYAIHTWKQGPQLGPGAPWDATADLAVMGQANGIYRLVELSTGREVARLEDQEQNTGPASFTRDGTKLVVLAKNGLRVWDLRRIREGLDELGLDWAAPPFPKASKPEDSPALEVTIDRGEMDALLFFENKVDQLRSRGDLVGALAAIRKAQAAAPNHARLTLYLAWLMAICPDPELRDALLAVELAQQAVKARPNDWECLRTLGLAHQVARDHKAAVKALTRSMELHRSGDAFDYFLLAAANQQLGHQEEARKWYDKGVAWMAANHHGYAAELALLRADTEVALGIGKQPNHSPAPPSPGKEK